MHCSDLHSDLAIMSDTEKAPQAAGVEEEGVTMLDVLEEEQALEDDCAAVLGNVSDTQCTYSQGYLARQPLYAAREATVPGQRAGVCLACSYHCLEVRPTDHVILTMASLLIINL